MGTTRKYRIEAEWKVWGYVDVDAESEEEALDIIARNTKSIHPDETKMVVGIRPASVEEIE